MNPGPSTAKNSMIRIRQRFHIGVDSYWRLIYIVSSLTITGRGVGCEAGRARLCKEASKEELTGRNYLGTLVLMYHGGFK
jgi:hypothetical protein